MRYSPYSNESDMRIERSSPERRLLVAMLRRAILDFLSGDSLESDEACEWIFSADETMPEQALNFSFNWVCGQLNIDAEQLVRQLRTMDREGADPRLFRKLN